VHELLPRRDDWTIDIVATDINTRALQIARAGRYGDWSFRAIDETRKRRYFAKDGQDWVLDTALRQMVRFLHSDLVADPMPDATCGLCDADLIMCRNVFIYMQPGAVAQVAAKLTAALADGGYLVTGHGELLGHNTHGLHTRVFAASVVMHKHDQPAAVVTVAPEAPRMQAPAPAPAPTTSATPAAAPAIKPVARAFTPAPRSAAEDFDAYMAQAWRQADSGLASEAERSCLAASNLAPFDPWPYYLRAQLAQERGDARDARQLLDKAIYLEPSLVAAYIELGGLLEQEGKHERARQMLLTAARELARLPGDTLIKPYENSSAADVLAYLDSRLAGAAA